MASSCSLQTACCHELSLAGTDSLSSEVWKEEAGTSDGEMTCLLSSQALPLSCLQPCGERWWCFLRAGNVFQRGLLQGSCLSVFPLCMCVFTCVFIYVFACVLLYLRVWWGAKKTTSAILPQALFTFLFDTWSLTGLELTVCTRLAEQRAPRTCLLPSPRD